jgi:hypothetical protein
MNDSFDLLFSVALGIGLAAATGVWAVRRLRRSRAA